MKFCIESSMSMSMVMLVQPQTSVFLHTILKMVFSGNENL